MAGWSSDLRLATRGIVRRPGFSAVVVISFGLAIAANTAIFSFVNAILLRSIPVSEPDRLVRIYSEFASGLRWASVSHPNYLDYVRFNRSFSSICAERPVAFMFGADDGSGDDRIVGSLVSANYFSTLGIQPAFGRSFAPDEDTVRGGNAVAVISDGFWRRRFAADPDVLKATLVLNGTPFKVIGVAPPDFMGLNVGLVTDVWVPLSMHNIGMPGPNLFEQRGITWLALTGRLKPGISIAQASANLNAIATTLRQQYPEDNAGISLTVIPEREASIHPPLRNAFVSLGILLQAVVGLVLLVACANIAGLLLARGSSRNREMGIRIAIGGGRGQLVRMLLVESMVLGLLGGALGMLLASWVARAIGAFRPPMALPVSFDLSFDTRVLLFSLLLTLFTALLFGLIPALRASRPSMVFALREGEGGGAGRSRLRNSLVVAQIAVTFVLLVGAGLFLRSLRNSQDIDLGFTPENMLLASMNLGFVDYSDDQGRRFIEELLTRIESLPDVRSASAATSLPFSLTESTLSASPEGFVPKPGEGEPQVDSNLVTPGYFKTMGSSLVAGREFNWMDRPNTPRVAIVNEALARKFFPNESAVGKRIMAGGAAHTVVGIVRDAKYNSLSDVARPYLYQDVIQRFRPGLTLHVRTTRDPASLIPAVQREVRTLDEKVLLFDLKPMVKQVDTVLLPARIASTLLGVMGGLALFLALVGLYGAMAYTLARRTREIGIRIALGARAHQVLRMILHDGLLLSTWGISIGLLLALAGTRLASSLLYGVSPFDLFAFAAALLLVMGLSLVANLFPALRATRVDPKLAMRTE
jgi:predicted permease